MSIVSSFLHKARVAAGLPAITLGNVAKAASSFIPIPGLAVAVNAGVDALGHAKSANVSTTDTLKAALDAKAVEIGTNIGVAREAVGNYNAVKDAVAAPVPLWLIGGAAALLLLGRK